MFIDTHCHLNIMTGKAPEARLTRDDFSHIAQIIDAAQDAGVGKIVNVGTSLSESLNSVEIAQRFESVFATVGIHPCDATERWYDDFKELVSLVKDKQRNKIVGIGETGLDFYHKPFFVQRQKDAFKAHIELALEYALPLVVHVREAGDEVLRIMEEYVPSGVRGVIHCFSQTQAFADQVIAWGFYIGIDAPITYPKNELLRSVVKHVPLSHLVIETDAPFLPPQQFRGQHNHPAYIPLFAPAIGEQQGVRVDVIEEMTTVNAEKLFGI